MNDDIEDALEARYWGKIDHGVTPKFSLGDTVATPGAIAALATTRQSFTEFLNRHIAGDWGEVDNGDKAYNDWSLNNEGRLLSAYKLTDGMRIWIITEADRSSTCILLPEEY